MIQTVCGFFVYTAIAKGLTHNKHICLRLMSCTGREHLQLYGRIKSAKWNWNAVKKESAELLDKVGSTTIEPACNAQSSREI